MAHWAGVRDTAWYANGLVIGRSPSGLASRF